MRRSFALLSILLLIACAIGWPRSRNHDEGFALSVGKLVAGASSSGGLVSLAMGTMNIDSARPIRVFGWSEYEEPPLNDLVAELHAAATHGMSRFGFMAGVGDDYGIVTVPWWSVAAVASIGPLTLLRTIVRRRRRKSRGLCLNCGYDLRAATHRCPECGTSFSRRGHATLIRE
jgi:hypothetical protein